MIVPTPPQTPPSSPHQPPGYARAIFLFVLALLAALTILSLGLVLSTLTRKSVATVPASVATPSGKHAISPVPVWQHLSTGTRLTRIAFGSCLDQSKPQPIWKAVVEANPQVFLLIGDNVYGDIKTADGRELQHAYARQAVQPELAMARAAMPFLATWDDHDYGANDAGASFAHKDISAELFAEFWQQPSIRQPDGGIYYSRTYGPAGSRVQVIMLDSRSFRSDWTRKDASFPHWGAYKPDDDPAKTMLGASQWQWLEARLKEPANIRLIVSSVQVLAEGHGFERWGNLPRERDKLLSLITQTGAKGVVLLSGDRHVGAFYQREVAGQTLFEVTSSSLNRAYGPSKDARIPPLISMIYFPENFATIDIDWVARTLAVVLRGRDGRPALERTLTFDALGSPKS